MKSRKGCFIIIGIVGIIFLVPFAFFVALWLESLFEEEPPIQTVVEAKVLADERMRIEADEEGFDWKKFAMVEYSCSRPARAWLFIYEKPSAGQIMSMGIIVNKFRETSASWLGLLPKSAKSSCVNSKTGEDCSLPPFRDTEC